MLDIAIKYLVAIPEIPIYKTGRICTVMDTHSPSLTHHSTLPVIPRFIIYPNQYVKELV